MPLDGNLPDYIINRQRLCEELRSGKHKQIIRQIGDYKNPNAPVCFIGVMIRVFGFEMYGNQHERFKLDLKDLVIKNNEGWTFPELADEIEKMGAF